MKHAAVALVVLGLSVSARVQAQTDGTTKFHGGDAERTSSFTGHEGWYWTGHGVVTAAALLVAPLINLRDPPHRNIKLVPGLDTWQRGSYAGGAEGLSSALFTVELLAPLPAFASLVPSSKAQRGIHAAFIYGEALAVSLALSETASTIWSRPRPYTYRNDDGDREKVLERTPSCRSLPRDACRSFYSGRASAAYAAAISSSFLFSELLNERYTMELDIYRTSRNLYQERYGEDGFANRERRSMAAAAWAMQLGLASLSTHLQVRAGEVFYSDALTGMAIGAAIGFGTYGLHWGSMRLSSAEVAGGAAGLAVGWLLPLVVTPGRSDYFSVLESASLVPYTGPGVGVALGNDF